MQQSLIQDWRGMAKPRKMAVWAAYLGWTLDAFGTDKICTTTAVFNTLP